MMSFKPSHVCIRPNPLLKIGELYMMLGWALDRESPRCMIRNKKHEAIIIDDVWWEDILIPIEEYRESRIDEILKNPED